MSASHNMYHPNHNPNPPPENGTDSPLTPEEFEKYSALLTLAYPQPKGSIKNAVMAKIAEEREAEKSGGKVLTPGKTSIFGRLASGKNSRRGKIHGKCDLVCAFDEAENNKADKVKRLRRVVSYASAAACVGIAAITAVVFWRAVPETVDSTAMDIAGNSAGYSDSADYGAGLKTATVGSGEEIIKQHGSNSYRAKSYSASAWAEDAAIAEDTASEEEYYSIYANKMMSPYADGANNAISELADEDIDPADEILPEEAPAVDENEENLMLSLTSKSENTAGEEKPAAPAPEADEADEASADEIPENLKNASAAPAKGFANSSGDGSAQSQIVSGSDECAGLMKLSANFLAANMAPDAKIPTDCPHSKVFKNSYHDIPKVFVNIVGQTTFNLWANSVVCETGDECSVNIAEFYAHFSEIDSDFAGKFAAVYSGDVTYYCDLPELSLFEEGKIDEIKAYYENGGDYASAVSRYFEYEYKSAIIGRVGVSNYTAWLAENGKTFLCDWTVDEIADAFGLTEADLGELRTQTEAEFPYTME